MNRVLIVAELDDNGLSTATAKTLSCAMQIPDAQIDIVVLAGDGTEAAEQAARLAGVARVLLIEHASFVNPLAALMAPEIAAVGAEHSHIFGSSTTFGRDLMPCIAARLGTVQISDVMAVESATRFRRPVYAGNAIATVETQSLPVVATARIASFAEAPTSEAVTADTVAEIVNRAPAVGMPEHTRFVSRDGVGSGKADLQTAARVVAGGRGVGSKENFEMIEALADVIGAAIGASRAAVDAGYVSNELQVGQTGKIIAPELYIAVGISGAIQHLTGMRDAGTIVAINQDADAAIFEVADIGLVGDLFEILPALTEKLAARQIN